MIDVGRQRRVALRLVREGRVRWLPVAAFEVDHRDGDVVGLDPLVLWELYVSGLLCVREGNTEEIASRRRAVELTAWGEELVERWSLGG